MSIQLKRAKHTFILSFKQAESVKVLDIKKELISVIKSIGGISDVDEDEDIDIPIPTFNDSDSDEEIAKEVPKDDNKIIPTVNDIKIGSPIDLNHPFDDGFNEVTEDKLNLKQFDVLAFAFNYESFSVVQPNADD